MSGINYPDIMAQVLRGVVAAVLKYVAEKGLPEPNYFVMDICTDHPGVEIPDWLRKQHPQEMRIILQHWFEDLNVGAAGFFVTLSFNNSPQPIYVPFAALKSFSDPGAGVTFSFPGPVPGESGDSPALDEPAADADTKGKVVSLENFRKG
ncbi:MAG: ClpXP protease specificity-enhancing factor SspB [Rhodobacteraceae bacterium]|nr:ClpXP protease specificity-enhancing factor SspB [Paracoccaceae bacterium]